MCVCVCVLETRNFEIYYNRVERKKHYRNIFLYKRTLNLLVLMIKITMKMFNQAYILIV